MVGLGWSAYGGGPRMECLGLGWRGYGAGAMLEGLRVHMEPHTEIIILHPLGEMAMKILHSQVKKMERRY